MQRGHFMLAVIACAGVSLSATAGAAATDCDVSTCLVTHSGSGAFVPAARGSARPARHSGGGANGSFIRVLGRWSHPGHSSVPAERSFDAAAVTMTSVLGNTPWTITTAHSDVLTTGLDDPAWFAGPAIRPVDDRSLVALPEPASLALILVGVLGLTAVRARRARRPKSGP
jgi:hypothetical protein